MRTKNADSVNKSALHLLLKQGVLLHLMLLCLINFFWKKWDFSAVELDISALTQSQTKCEEVRHLKCIICEYLVLRPGKFLFSWELHYRRWHIGNSVHFFLILQVGRYLAPRTLLKCGFFFYPSVLWPWKLWHIIGSKSHTRVDLSQCNVNGRGSVCENGKHREIFVSVPAWLSLQWASKVLHLRKVMTWRKCSMWKIT